jgi:signal transduction histidine kinase
MSLMRRVKANIAQMSTLLDQILQLSRKNLFSISNNTKVDINEAIEIAINSVRSKVRDKGLRLDLDLADDLPPIQTEGDVFYQIVAHLLDNACQVSRNDGRILISAHHDSIQEKSGEGETKLFDFLHLAVTDSGNGLSQELHSLVLEANRQPDKVKANAIEEVAQSLSTAVFLVNAQGGRVWLSKEWETGDTLSILLPLSGNGYVNQNGKSHS